MNHPRRLWRTAAVPYALAPFNEIGLDEALLQLLIDEHESTAMPEYERFWSYYRNPSEPIEIRDRGGRRTAWRPAQARYLPHRLLRHATGGSPKEIVVENDIAWRIETLVNYVTNGRTRLLSRADDPERREFLEAAAWSILEANGGQQFIQDASLQGSIYGHVDLVLRAEALFDSAGASTAASAPRRRRVGNTGSEGALDRNAPSTSDARRRIIDTAATLNVEMVEAPRAIPLLDPDDYQRLLGYIVYFRKWTNEVDQATFLERTARRAGLLADRPARARATATVCEIISPTRRQVYEDETLIFDGANPLGMLPVVHIQNLPQPYFYEGLGDVEPLIPLQNELNIRLSDRANRVTLQSFKMYLGKGFDGFGERPIAPGQMWTTDNENASIEAFGGDAESPSEDRHIDEIRAAMDKTSSVSPLAAGLIRTKVGTLSSENALRISLLGILAKTERKRQAYGRGLRDLMRLAFTALDRAGVLRTTPEEREFEVVWESPLPLDETKQLENARIKHELGVPRDRILAELGYDAEELNTRRA